MRYRRSQDHSQPAADDLSAVAPALTRPPAPPCSSKSAGQAERIRRDNELIEDLESQIAELEEDRSEQALDRLVQKSKSAAKGEGSVASTNAPPLA